MLNPAELEELRRLQSLVKRIHFEVMPLRNFRYITEDNIGACRIAIDQLPHKSLHGLFVAFRARNSRLHYVRSRVIPARWNSEHGTERAKSELAIFC